MLRSKARSAKASGEIRNVASSDSTRPEGITDNNGGTAYPIFIEVP